MERLQTPVRGNLSLKEIPPSEDKEALGLQETPQTWSQENCVQAHFVYYLAVWSQANHSTSLSLHFLICENGDSSPGRLWPRSFPIPTYYYLLRDCQVLPQLFMPPRFRAAVLRHQNHPGPCSHSDCPAPPLELLKQ